MVSYLLDPIDDILSSPHHPIASISWLRGFAGGVVLRYRTPLARCRSVPQRVENMVEGDGDLQTLPPITLSFFGVGDPAAAFFPRGFLGVVVVAVDEPRGGASGRAPESISSRSLRASFLMMRKRPSMES